MHLSVGSPYGNWTIIEANSGRNSPVELMFVRNTNVVHSGRRSSTSSSIEIITSENTEDEGSLTTPDEQNASSVQTQTENVAMTATVEDIQNEKPVPFFHAG